MTATAPQPGGEGRGGRGGDRRHRFPGRRRQVFVRLDQDEYDTITAAAARLELTPTGYVAETALAAARGHTTPTGGQADAAGVTRAELARLQRELFATRTALNQAVAALHPTGTPPSSLNAAVGHVRRMLEAVDAAVAAIDRTLR